jgi:hypothetical protein
MTWRHAQETALFATLIAVLLLLYAQLDFYIRHTQG